MPHRALEQILGAALFEAGNDVKIGGADPVFRTRYRVGTAGAASLAALGLAAARLWQARGGRAQSISIDVAPAAASLRSATYLRVNGKSAKET